jgi:hypothetical protein
MPRNMSFFLTTDQARRRVKDVTRRLGWWFLKPGDIVQQVVKSQGLKKGEHVQKIHLIKIISTGPEPLRTLTDRPDYGAAEMVREGFPDMAPADFVAMLCRHHNCTPSTPVNRIEFVYI